MRFFRTGECAPDISCQEQPLSASFEKIYQFIGWYDQWIDLHGNILRQRDQDAFHAVHSLIWSIAGRCIRSKLNSGVECFLGCGQLSTLEEQLVIVFTEMRGDDNNRLTVTINQAYKVQSFSSSRGHIHVPKQTGRGLGTANTSRQSRYYLNPMSGVDCR